MEILNMVAVGVMLLMGVLFITALLWVIIVMLFTSSQCWQVNYDTRVHGLMSASREEDGIPVAVAREMELDHALAYLSMFEDAVFIKKTKGLFKGRKIKEGTRLFTVARLVFPQRAT